MADVDVNDRVEGEIVFTIPLKATLSPSEASSPCPASQHESVLGTLKSRMTSPNQQLYHLYIHQAKGQVRLRMCKWQWHE
jgi:hypothetical protein